MLCRTIDPIVSRTAPTPAPTVGHASPLRRGAPLRGRAGSPITWFGGVILDVLELAERLARAAHTDTVALLLIAQRCGDERVALSIEDREAIIDVLADTPDTLAEAPRRPRARADVQRPRQHGVAGRGHRTPSSYRTRPATSEADTALPVSVSSRPRLSSRRAAALFWPHARMRLCGCWAYVSCIRVREAQVTNRCRR